MRISRREIGKGEVELGVFHVHIYPDKAFVRGKFQACLNGVVKEIADDGAQVQFRYLQGKGDLGLRQDRDVSRSGQGNFAV